MNNYVPHGNKIKKINPEDFFVESRKQSKNFHAEAATGGVLLKKVVLRNFAIISGKQLFWSPFIIKLQVLMPITLFKKESKTVFFQ